MRLPQAPSEGVGRHDYSIPLAEGRKARQRRHRGHRLFHGGSPRIAFLEGAL